MLRGGQELVRDFQSKWPFMSSCFLVLCFSEPRAYSKELLHRYMRDQGSEKQPATLSSPLGHRWGLALDTQYLFI